jgi:16S rRNA (guanine966-N2)-methyltransferase
MRVIAGSLGGRIFESPHGHRTHPMSEKTRGALFNALGDIKGLTVVDAFSGTGAIAFEAISRGAKHVIAIEFDKGAHAIIIKNAETLGVEKQITPIRTRVVAWNTRNRGKEFDIVIADPPFDDLGENVLEKKLAFNTKVGGLFVLSLPPHARIVLGENFEQILQKSYGDNRLIFYRRLK